MLDNTMTLAPLNTTNVSDVTGLLAYNTEELELDGQAWANFVTYAEEFGQGPKRNNGQRLMDLFARDYDDALEHCRQLGLDTLEVYDIYCESEAVSDDDRFNHPLFWIYLARELDRQVFSESL